MNTRPKAATANKNTFYKNYYNQLIYALIATCVVLLLLIFLVFYQLNYRPKPSFSVINSDNKIRYLTAADSPNLTPATLLKWASKAAGDIYTFDFNRSAQQLAALRPYFTENGWTAYTLAIQGLISKVIDGGLFVNGIVSGTPVISNEGELPFTGYSWRIQLPFLVTYQSAGDSQTQNYMVTLMVIKVPTATNPAGIAIDEFTMS